MPYVGPRLADLFTGDATRDTARELAVRGGDMLHDHAVMWTPVDTGNLRSAWHRSAPRRVTLVAFPAYVVVVRNDTSYARDVEEGTGLFGPYGTKYPIEPRTPGGVLSWVTKRGFINKAGEFVPPGTRVFAKRVMHPGSEGHHMMQRAAAYVDARWPDGRERDAMIEWVRRMELRFREVGRWP